MRAAEIIVHFSGGSVQGGLPSIISAADRRKMQSSVLKAAILTCFILMLAGCGEIDTTYTTSRHLNPRENRAAAALVDSTAHRLALRLDKEGLSPSWHSFHRGALSIEIGALPAAPTWVFIADDRLRRKRAFNSAKQTLTLGLRHIDANIRIVTSWEASTW